MTPIALAFVQLLGTVIALALAVYAYRRRDRPGVIWLVVVLLGDAVWMLAAGINYASRSLTVSTAMLQLRYVGITIIPIALFFFALEYTGYDERLTRRRRILITLPAVGAFVLAMTDHLHGLFYASVTSASNLQHAAYQYGALAVPWIAYAFLLVVVAVAVFVRYAMVADRVYRRQALALAGVISMGTIADVLFFLPVRPNEFTITPLAILLASAIAVGIIVRYDFVRLVPATRELGRKELIERMDLGMLVVTDEGVVADVNPAAARILGQRPGDLLGEQAPDSLPDRDGPNVVERTVTVDGVDREFEIRTNRVGDRSGITLITFQELEDLTGIVSHDLQGPLMEIRGSADLAISTGEITHVDRVLTAANRIDELASDLLQLAHTGRQLETEEPVDLAALAETAWGTLWSPNADLIVETDRTVIGDPDRIQQLFENLFRNSIDHGSPDDDQTDGPVVRTGVNSDGTQESYTSGAEGGPEQETATEPLSITVGTIPDGFYVEDTGQGIPLGEHERVFEKGYTNSSTGTGLGLSIVRQIVSAHGWSVRATVGTTGGARFEITGVEFDGETESEDV